MNYDAIKNIYSCILLSGCSIEWLDNNKYKLIRYYENGNRHYEERYKNGVLHGKYIVWYENGNKYLEQEYKNGYPNGKCIAYNEHGKECYKEI